jgi:uncharacterized protein YgbK (DUF1537 family)
MDVLAIADDLTGALEAGVMFAGYGFDCVVGFGIAQDASVVVVDTESRHDTPNVAEEKILQLTAPSARLIYKKTDSTLRGNIGSELRGLARAYAGSRIAYVPAYPEMGRTVRNGRLYVNGIPVHRTAFGRDELNPVSDCRLRHLIDDDINCDVFDGETEGDVDEAARTILSHNEYRIAAGPAAIARSLARRLRPNEGHIVEWPKVERCLVVNGSRTVVSRGQIETALNNGWIQTESAAAWSLLPPTSTSEASPSDVARAIGCAVRDRVSAGTYDAIMIFGGDTAVNIVQALGVDVLRPIAEVVPGVACSSAGGFTFITKAGGFGPLDVILHAQQFIGKHHD